MRIESDTTNTFHGTSLMPSRTSVFTASLLFLFTLASFQSIEAAPPLRPNIVVILADDLGCGDMSLYDGWIQTPRIDQMAKEGVKFTDFHSNCSVCSPTRIAFMTGRYQQRLGIVDVIVGHRDKDGLEPSETTVSSWMKKAGHNTAIVGQ